MVINNIFLLMALLPGQVRDPVQLVEREMFEHLARFELSDHTLRWEASLALARICRENEPGVGLLIRKLEDPGTDPKHPHWRLQYRSGLIDALRLVGRPYPDRAIELLKGVILGDGEADMVLRSA